MMNYSFIETLFAGRHEASESVALFIGEKNRRAFFPDDPIPKTHVAPLRHEVRFEVGYLTSPPLFGLHSTAGIIT